MTAPEDLPALIRAGFDRSLRCGTDCPERGFVHRHVGDQIENLYRGLGVGDDGQMVYGQKIREGEGA